MTTFSLNAFNNPVILRNGKQYHNSEYTVFLRLGDHVTKILFKNLKKSCGSLNVFQTYQVSSRCPYT